LVNRRAVGFYTDEEGKVRPITGRARGRFRVKLTRSTHVANYAGASSKTRIKSPKKIDCFTWSLSAGRFKPHVQVSGYDPILKRHDTHVAAFDSPEVQEILRNMPKEDRKRLVEKWQSFSAIVNRGGYDVMKRAPSGEVVKPDYALLNDTSKAIETSLQKKFGDDPLIQAKEKLE
jgi:hypothetical protein